MIPSLWIPDIVGVKNAIRQGRFKVTFYGKKILLQDTQTGERVMIGELPKGDEKE